MDEKPLDPIVSEHMGEDPSVSKAKVLAINSSILRHLHHIVQNGLIKEQQMPLVKKYAVPGDLLAPALNPVIGERIGQKSRHKDDLRYKTQEAISVSLTGLATLITMVSDAGEEGPDRNEFVEVLTDTARLLADTHHEISVSRRANITPRFDKNYKLMMEKRNIDKFLFGEDFDAKVKELKDAQKLMVNAMPPSTMAAHISAQKGSRFPTQGNFRRPGQPRPLFNRAQNIQSGGQGKPRLPFKKYQHSTQKSGQQQQQKGKPFN